MSVFLISSPGSSYSVKLALHCRVVFGNQYPRKLGKMLVVTIFPLCFGDEVEDGEMVEYYNIFLWLLWKENSF